MKLRLILFTLFMAMITSCHEDEPIQPSIPITHTYSAQVVTEWMGLLLKLTQEGPGFTPPVAARAFGYVGLTLYESVRQGAPGYKSMAGQVNGLTADLIPKVQNEEYHWGAVANAALATITRSCYANASIKNLKAINALEAGFNNEVFKNETTKEVLERSIAYGNSVGAAMAMYASSDHQGSCYNNNFPQDYIPAIGEGLWIPTPPAFQRALQPYWGNVRPFLTKNVADVSLPPPPGYSRDTTSPFWKEAMEVYHTVQHLTPEQHSIAHFWSDDPGKTATPPGHSIAIVKQVLEQEKADLFLAAEAFARVGMGVHDAFVSCWNAKYRYNLVRPISVIQAYIDPAFTIPLSTPPFPEYPSGHSVQSGATAQILTDLFGEDYAFVDRTHAGRKDIDGSSRVFSSFHELAREAAISRLYGGIHYTSAIEKGLTQGKEIGSNINSLFIK